MLKTDIEIARAGSPKPISEIANYLGLSSDEIEPYGHYKAKISLDVVKRLQGKSDGKLILVTAINPTKAGEGKTTVNVGLSMGLNRIGRRTVTILREPSLGPCFGVKGGAAGGGYSQVVPMEDINLHFTGDLHAITVANNLLAGLLDNHLHQGNELGLDPRRIVWRRVMDLNERALRNVVVSLGGSKHGIPREEHFDITAASEVMAILSLASDAQDLKLRLGRIVVGYTFQGKPVFAKDLNATGAMAVLLKDALKPNLVQTLENTPAILHCGPFANIAHGCNSVIATKMALKLGDYVVTEAGFGADLGAEKFLNIKCRVANLKPNAVVIVATIRALKNQGGVETNDLNKENLHALKAGFSNLEKHIENIEKFGIRPLVAINTFFSDTKQEVQLLQGLCAKMDVEAVPADVWGQGGKGSENLAEAVVSHIDKHPSQYKPLYSLQVSIVEKIETIAKEIYGADGVDFTPEVLETIKKLEVEGFADKPVCMAKTQYSISDNPNLMGRPKDFRITVKELRISNGAGFLVALTGDIMTMPGLPKIPAANAMDIFPNGEVTGLF